MQPRRQTNNKNCTELEDAHTTTAKAQEKAENNANMLQKAELGNEALQAEI